MHPEDLYALARYQTCLFTALTGVLIGRGMSSREEIAAALDVVAQTEQDQTVEALLGLASASLRSPNAAPNAEPSPTRAFEVIAGGKI